MRTVERVQRVVETPVAKEPEPDLGTGVIPASRYTSPDYMAREWERLWTRVWLMGGLLSDLEEPGSYITTDIGRESVIIVRDHGGELRAFYNVCQHRGNRLCLARSGQSDTLRCGFHHWEYDLDGSIRSIPDLDDFKQGKPDYGLTEIACAVWGAWVWFNLNPEAEPLEQFLNIIPEHLDAYRFDDMHVYEDVTVEWACNWKTSVDAFNESYHVQAIHPQIMDYFDDVNPQIDLYDKHSRYLCPMAIPSPRMDLGDKVPSGLAEMMKSQGMDVEQYEGRVLEIRRDLQLHKRETGPSKGFEYSRLNDDQLTDNYHYMIFPNITLNITSDHLMMFRQRPHPTDPDRMFFDMQLHVRVPEGDTPPPRSEHQVVKHGEYSMGEIVDQDSFSLPGTQDGLHSEGFRGLWLGYQERRIRHFHATLEEYLSRA